MWLLELVGSWQFVANFFTQHPRPPNTMASPPGEKRTQVGTPKFLKSYKRYKSHRNPWDHIYLPTFTSPLKFRGLGRVRCFVVTFSSDEDLVFTKLYSSTPKVSTKHHDLTPLQNTFSTQRPDSNKKTKKLFVENSKLILNDVKIINTCFVEHVVHNWFCSDKWVPRGIALLKCSFYPKQATFSYSAHRFFSQRWCSAHRMFLPRWCGAHKFVLQTWWGAHRFFLQRWCAAHRFSYNDGVVHTDFS